MREEVKAAGEGQAGPQPSGFFRPPSKITQVALVILALVLLVGVTRRVLTGTPEAAVVPSSTTTTTVALKSEAETLYADFTQAVGPCDEAGDRAKTLIQGASDPSAVYAAMTTAKDACLESAQAIQHLNPPLSASAATQERFKETLTICAGAYSAKWGVYRRIATILDGDGRPSKIADAKDMMDVASEAMANCIPSLMSVVHEAGGVIPDLDDKSR